MSKVSDSARPWALITGASEGLGKEFALQLAERGTHNLVLAARSVDKLDSVLWAPMAPFHSTTLSRRSTRRYFAKLPRSATR